MSDKKIIAINEEYGPDDSDFPADAEWCVYYYECGSYEGSGEAFFGGGGKFWVKSLGHCSCYGPWDDTPSEITRKELLEMHLIGDGDRIKLLRKAIYPLIRESLNDSSENGND